MQYNFFNKIFVLFFLLQSCVNSDSEKNTLNGEESARPNIIYIMADDLTIQAISAYEGIYQHIAPTPNIDRIAAEGMLFHNVMCTNAICGPSRASILTGKYSNIHGYYKNESGGKFDASQWTFPQEFQKNEYHTALFGKWHLGSEPKGFDIYKYHNAAVQQGTYWDPLYNENGKDVREKGYATNLTTDFALDWLKQQKTGKEPFLMLLQYKAPHRPWKPDSTYLNLWKNKEIPYPDTFDDDYKGRKSTAGDTEMTLDYLTRSDMKLKPPENLKAKERVQWNMYGAKAGEIVQPEGMTYEEGKKWRYQKFIKDYLACVKSVDDNIGRVLDYLNENDLAENTVVIITSDQGFYLGDHGFFDKRFIYKESIKMPFMIRYPKLVKRGSENRDIIANIDFAPTLLDLAGIVNSPKIQGKSFVPMLRGEKSSSWRESIYYHYYEFPFWHHVQPHYGIRTRHYTLAHFYYDIDKWELYDLEKDPNELHNVAYEPEYATVLDSLRYQLEQLMRRYDDNKSLEKFREISDKDFGNISERTESAEMIEDRTEN
ncbi:sulfatase family protein [Zunongwangia profunda]|uniref:sulfatase family protein n=1 Tax=Zunongwangia profunda TaxID=398743 RepID=UPI001D1800D5|nr:sulfatase [Zunongwangia profunda]MCC4226809.1 sulfatase [Zunongwangia profunda]